MWGRRKRKEPSVTPEPGEIAEAARNPGGWVYRISGAYGPDDAVPPAAIAGAWKVGEDGRIVGEFMPNPNFGPSSEAADPGTESPVRNRLQQAVVALAQPAEVQLALFPDFVWKAQELALSFEDGLYEMVGHKDEFTAPQMAAIHAIEARLMRRDHDDEFWTDEGVRSNPVWEEVRALAKAAASTFGWVLDPPLPVPGVYVPGGR